jgi:hypothetical protein
MVMFLLNQRHRELRKEEGFPDEEDCGIGNHGGIWVNFISRWKQCPPKDLSNDDLQNNSVLQGLGLCPNGVFMVLEFHMTQALFKITFKENTF